MRRVVSLVAAMLCLLTFLSGTIQAGPPTPQGQATLRPGPAGQAGENVRIAPDVRKSIQSLATGQMVSVIVTLKDQADLAGVGARDRGMQLSQVVTRLQARASASQQALRAMLMLRHFQGQVGQITYFWIFNGFAVTATADVIQELAARDEVLRITANETIQAPASLATDDPPEPNLAVINAPALWDLGFRGQGIVVASVDTGVDIKHPDLSDRWRGGSNSWFDPNGEHPTTPADVNGHGTQAMGIMAGGDEGGTAVGVAPEAQWIAVKLFDDRGSATVAGIHQGFQWLLDPDGDPFTPDAPQVVNNSWTYGNPGCQLEFQLDLQALRAAGIVPIFSAGSAGPDRAISPSPANYPEAFAVGATDMGDGIYSYSSRGPSACGEAETIFPELVAPGVDVRTTDLAGGYSVGTGTSLAAPHVAGALALLLSAYPDLTVAAQEAALINSAVDLGPPGPDNDFGYGRLDVLAAYRWLSGGDSTSTPTATPPARHVYLPWVSANGGYPRFALTPTPASP